jgi:type IV pilus assembly protein PilF
MKKNSLIKSLVFMLIYLLVGCQTQPSTSVDHEAIRSRSRAHTDLGAAYFQQGKMDIALEEFTLAAEIDPSFGFAFNGLGLVNAALKQDDAAKRAFNKAISLEPENSEARNNYGNFLCSRGQYKESIQEYLIAVKNPVYATPAGAYTNAGICASRGNDKKNAEVYFTKALEIEPLNQVAAYELASLQFERKSAALAYKTLSNVLVAKPNAQVLFLAMQIAKTMHFDSDENQLRERLLKEYPASNEAKSLMTK